MIRLLVAELQSENEGKEVKNAALIVTFEVQALPDAVNRSPDARDVLFNDQMIGGPGRDRTDDLFHAMELADS